MRKKCKWRYDSTHEKWDTQCEEAHCFFEGSPKDNNYKFCPYCGKEIWQLKIGWEG